MFIGTDPKTFMFPIMLVVFLLALILQRLPQYLEDKRKDRARLKCKHYFEVSREWLTARGMKTSETVFPVNEGTCAEGEVRLITRDGYVGGVHVGHCFSVEAAQGRFVDQSAFAAQSGWRTLKTLLEPLTFGVLLLAMLGGIVGVSKLPMYLPWSISLPWWTWPTLLFFGGPILGLPSNKEELGGDIAGPLNAATKAAGMGLLIVICWVAAIALVIGHHL